jgi:hypothetical protein
MLIGQCVKEGCEGSKCEETNFGKQTNHNSRLIYCRAVANSKWKWPILISGGMQQSDFYCSKVSILVSEGVHTCVRRCTYLCQKMYILVSEGVRTCVRRCTYLCQKVYVLVSEGVRTCVRRCTYLCQKVYILNVTAQIVFECDGTSVEK